MNELKFHLVPREGLQIAMGNQTCDGFSVHPQGAGAGSVPDVERLKGEYYVLRGLDERGFPREEKLRELGLDELRERLYPGKSS